MKTPKLLNAILLAVLAMAPLHFAHAATIMVNTTDDTGTTGNCSLRDAIEAANTDAVVDTCTAGSGADTIEFDASVTDLINLNTTALEINSDVTVNGNGLIAIKSVPGGPAFRIDSGNFMLNGSTLQDGTYGLSIFNNANVTVTNSIVSNNTNDGIFTDSSGTVTITRSLIRGNGCGINAQQGTLNISNTTISENTGSTINVGGMLSRGTTNLVNVTITNNTGRDVGGIYQGAGTVNIQNTLIAGNIDPDSSYNGTNPNCNSFLTSQGNNILGDSQGCFGLTDGVNGDRVGLTIQQIGLDTSLAANGGPTQTHALLAGSLAIDAGDNTACQALGSTDQRGTGYDRIADGNNDGTATCDIGAFELAAATPGTTTGSTVGTTGVTSGTTGSTTSTSTTGGSTGSASTPPASGGCSLIR